MKKKFIWNSFRISILAILFATLFSSSIQKSNATELKFGRWIAVYEGGSNIHHWECVSTFWQHACTMGDIKVANNTD